MTNAWRGRSDPGAMLLTLALGWLAAGGALYVFGSDPRAAVATGFGWAAVFTAFAWLAGQPRWSWAKAAVAAAAMLLGRTLGVALAEPGGGTAAVMERIASGAGAVIVFLWLAHRAHREDGRAGIDRTRVG